MDGWVGGRRTCVCAHCGEFPLLLLCTGHLVGGGLDWLDVEGGPGLNVEHCLVGWLGRWVGWIEEDEAVRMSHCEVGVWWVGGWMGGWFG